jgi:hypothetical protein
LESSARQKNCHEDFRKAEKIVLLCRLFLLMDIFSDSSETAYRPAV